MQKKKKWNRSQRFTTRGNEDRNVTAPSQSRAPNGDEPQAPRLESRIGDFNGSKSAHAKNAFNCFATVLLINQEHTLSIFAIMHIFEGVFQSFERVGSRDHLVQF